MHAIDADEPENSKRPKIKTPAQSSSQKTKAQTPPRRLSTYSKTDSDQKRRRQAATIAAYLKPK